MQPLNEMKEWKSIYDLMTLTGHYSKWVKAKIRQTNFSITIELDGVIITGIFQNRPN